MEVGDLKAPVSRVSASMQEAIPSRLEMLFFSLIHVDFFKGRGTLAGNHGLGFHGGRYVK